MKSGKVLDSSHRLVDLKRKHSNRGSISSDAAGATQLLIPLPSSPRLCDHNLTKRRKLDGPKNKYSNSAFPSGKALFKNDMNFKKSGILQRLMYYCNDEWNDFPQDIVAMANKVLISEKPVIELEVNENKILLDFLDMKLVDLNTGLHQSIAWIDVSGKCFFPVVLNEFAEPHNCHNEFALDHDQLGAEPQESNNINLHLEIEVRQSNGESSGESNAIVEQLEAHENAALNNSDDDKNSYAGVSNVVVEDKCVKNQPMALMHDCVPHSLDSDTVKKIFFKAISSTTAKIDEILRSMSSTLQTRLELFEKQVEITRRYRGDANIQYAWLPCSRGAISTILKYGVGHYEPLKTKPLYGIGIYLVPANGTQIRACVWKGEG